MGGGELGMDGPTITRMEYARDKQFDIATVTIHFELNGVEQPLHLRIAGPLGVQRTMNRAAAELLRQLADAVEREEARPKRRP